MRLSKTRKVRGKSFERENIRTLFSEGIHHLLQKSMETRRIDPELSREYYRSARKMGMRGRYHLPKQFRLYYCHSCLMPISSSTTRIRLISKKKQIHYKCLRCGNEHRFGYKEKND